MITLTYYYKALHYLKLTTYASVQTLVINEPFLIANTVTIWMYLLSPLLTNVCIGFLGATWVCIKETSLLNLFFFFFLLRLVISGPEQ